MSTFEPEHTADWRGFRRWMLASILCAIAIPALIASAPEHVGKGFEGTEYHADPLEDLRLAAIIGAMFVSGAALGAAIGSVKGEQVTFAVVGIFVGPMLLIGLGLVYSLIRDVGS